MLDLKELYWLAGLIEGEGCFSFDRCRDYEGRNPRLRFQLNMIDRDVLKHAHGILNIGKLLGPYKPRTKRTRFYAWQVYKDRDVAALMMMIYPLMGDRRQQIIYEMLEEWRTLPTIISRKENGKSGVLSKHSV